MEKTKRVRRTNARQEEDEMADRLSDLPDNLIHQIMSFLDIKSAVQTCVLSKRWDRMWVSLPDLDMDDAQWDTPLSFRKFVLKLLSTRADFNVGKFQINELIGFDDYLLRKIIDLVVSHSVEHLELCLHYETRFCFLYPLAMSNLLKTLELIHFILGDLHRSFAFRFNTLTSLNLSCCLFCYTKPSHNFVLADPFASCPNLKNLCLQLCGLFGSLRVLKISVPQLLNLKIEYPYGDYKILAPRLKSFSLKGIFASFGRLSGLDLPSLSSAEIYFEEEYWSTRSQHGIIVDDDDDAMDMDYVLGFVEQQPSPFKRLKSLKVQCKGKSTVVPARVRTYLLGDDPYEEIMHVEGGTDEETILYVEFQKVHADVQLLPSFEK